MLCAQIEGKHLHIHIMLFNELVIEFKRCRGDKLDCCWNRYICIYIEREACLYRGLVRVYTCLSTSPCDMSRSNIGGVPGGIEIAG